MIHTMGRVDGQPSPRAFFPKDTHDFDLGQYEQLVVQYSSAPGYIELVRECQNHGARVLVEADDWLHGVREVPDHRHRLNLRGEDLQRISDLIKQADGLIVSTDYLANLYEQWNENIWVCPNGLDLSRYIYVRPERENPVIGWAGADGHQEALNKWLPSIAMAMSMHEEATFTSIYGDPTGAIQEFGITAERTRRIGGQTLDNYPATLTHFDIGLAPAGSTDWALCKSELRWMEMSALGIPSVVDPRVYESARDGITALCAESSEEALGHLIALLSDPDLRWRIGQAARDQVWESFGIESRTKFWEEALTAS